MKAPVNITTAQLLEESGLQSGDPVHVGLCGPPNPTNDALFLRRMVIDNHVLGVVVDIRGREEELPWGDIIELWPIPPAFALCGPAKASHVSRYKEKIYGEK